jgi:hypothetical protein
MKPASSVFASLVLMGAGAARAAEVEEPWDRIPPPAESLLKADVNLGDGGDSVLRFGGHERTMIESYRNRDFGFASVQDDTWVHHRIQAFAEWSPVDTFQIKAELTWGEMQGMRDTPAPVDEDHPDILQLYAHDVIMLEDGSELIIRVGRQEIYYGSGRLLAHREGANQRLTHDALRIGWRRDDWRMDAIIASPVRISPDGFDNRSHFEQTLLWGFYATGPSPWAGGGSFDLYYLGLDRDSSPLAPGEHDLRHTFGTRRFGKAGPWSHNHEFILQTGKVGDREVIAGAASLGIGYTFEHAPLKPTLGFRGDLISGGQDEELIHTFDPLFQANNYFNEGGFVTPSNLYNLNPRLALDLGHGFSLELGVNFQWRFDSSDGVYAPPFHAIAGAAPHGESYLGTACNASLSWDPHPAFSFSLGFTHHKAGPSLTSVGGQSVDYFQASARLEF